MVIRGLAVLQQYISSKSNVTDFKPPNFASEGSYSVTLKRPLNFWYLCLDGKVLTIVVFEGCVCRIFLKGHMYVVTSNKKNPKF